MKLFAVTVLFIVGLAFSAASQDKLPPFVSSTELLQRVDSLRSEDDAEAALDLLNLILPGDTNYIEALIIKSSTLSELEMYQASLDLCKMAMEKYPDERYASFWLNAGYVLDLMGEKQAALDTYQEMVIEYPFMQKVRNNISYELLELNRYDSAYTAYKTQAQMFPFDDNMHFNLGVFAFNEGHLTEAFMAFNMSIILAPYSDRAFRALQFLNEISNNTKLDQTHKEGFEFESDEFKDIDLLINNYIALKKGYKVKTESDLYLAKQNHLIFNQLQEIEISDYFFSEYYIPFYRSILDEGKFNDMQVFLLIPSKGKTHKALVDKRIGNLREFNDWFRGKWHDLHNELDVDYGGYKGTFKTRYYSNGDLESISEYNSETDMVEGNQVFFFNKGHKSSEGRKVDSNKEGVWKNYYENGNLKQEVNYSDNVVSDSVLLYHSNGKVSERLFFKEGKRNGNFIEYFETGTMSHLGNYHDNEYDGVVNYYFGNGVVEYIVEYDNGILTGELQEFYANGKLYRTENFTEGKANGSYRLFWPEGTDRVVATRVNGKFHGKYTKYYPNEEVETEGQFHEGTRVGDWKEYFNDGKLYESYGYNDKGKLVGIYNEYTTKANLLSEIEYKNGFLTTYKFFSATGDLLSEGGTKKKVFHYKSFHSNGAVNSEGDYQNFVGKIGEWTEFDAYGNKKKIYNYKQGSLHGSYEVYFSTGEIKESYTYEEGSLEGYFAEYYVTGQLLREGYFSAGEHEGRWRKFYQDGALLREWNNQTGEIVGLDFDYTVAGKLYSIEEYKAGELIGGAYYDSTGAELNAFRFPFREGIYERNHADGSPEFRGKYIMGESDSLYTWNYPNGTLELIGQYSSVGKEGEWKAYHENGALMSTSNYVNGFQTGQELEYYDSGELEEERIYLYGDLHGVNTDYHKSGKLEQVVQYTNGSIDGSNIFYDDTEQLQVAREYDMGILVSYFYLGENGDTIRTPISQGTVEIKAKYASGKPSREFNILKGDFYGPYKVYHSNGNLILDYTLVNDNRHGDYTSYYTNGNLKTKYIYDNGKLQGAAVKYFESGKKKKTYTYLNGKKHGVEINYDEAGNEVSKIMYYNGKNYGEI